MLLLLSILALKSIHKVSGAHHCGSEERYVVLRYLRFVNVMLTTYSTAQTATRKDIVKAGAE